MKKISLDNLSFEDTVTSLLSGEVILLTPQNGSNPKKDLLIKMSGGEEQVTLISRPKTTMSGFGRGNYWDMYDIKLNTLSLYPTYIFDEEKYSIPTKFKPYELVSYESEKGWDIALVEDIYLREDNNEIMYKISGEDDYYPEEDLQKEKGNIRVTTESSNSSNLGVWMLLGEQDLDSKVYVKRE